MSIGKVCSRIVYTANPDETVLAAAARMKTYDVGTLVVVDAANRPTGILTDRDLVLRVLVEGRLPDLTLVEEIMTTNPESLPEHTPCEDALNSMRARGVRRLPVVGGRGELVGLLSSSDLLELLADELANLGGAVGHRTLGSRRPNATKPRGERSVIERAGGDPEC
ncbi:MAG: hypothetical protein RL398_1347 [Planctomycetota bacterium]|jgi:CBS domain-containing protein